VTAKVKAARKKKPAPTLTKAELEGLLAEAVHTSFRKGSGHADAHKVWLAIRDMDEQAFSDCMDWCLWSLFYAKEHR